MKNLFKIIIIAIITSVAVSSCKQVSVIKRKYNKGYYVSHTHKLPETKGESSTATTVVKKPEYLKPVPITSLGLDATKTTENKYAPTASADALQKTDKNYNHAKETKNFMGTNLSFKEINLMPVKLFSKGAINDLSGRSDDNEGLSLLWIIIVIILILWLLGFVFDGFGFGYGIHLLALIALILLILWLLKII